MHVCKDLDISILKDCPPNDLHLLNLTGNTAQAMLGDSAVAFGYASRKRRAWQGTIVGEIGYEHNGMHFSNDAFVNPRQLLFQGAQDLGMSGGPAINGYG
jgi:hypothetical protein